jgi:pimeloyl-ACP methyl ester carboxylesterase
VSTQTIERMAVEIDGEGDAAILVHGLGGTSNVFTPLAGVFAGRCRTIRPDLPGSGRSPSAGKLTIQGFVDAIVKMAKVLGIERAHLVGHSMGTIICQHLAVQQPRLARSLALLGPLVAPGDAARKGLKDRAGKARSEGMAPIADALVQAALSADTRSGQPVTVTLVREILMRQDPEGYARTCEALSEAGGADIARIGCPTLLITGDEDAVAPPSEVQAMAKRIPDARATVFSRCGHWATFERAQEVIAALKEFYSRRL